MRIFLRLQNFFFFLVGWRVVPFLQCLNSCRLILGACWDCRKQYCKQKMWWDLLGLRWNLDWDIWSLSYVVTFLLLTHVQTDFLLASTYFQVNGRSDICINVLLDGWSPFKVCVFFKDEVYVCTIPLSIQWKLWASWFHL